MGNFNEKLPKWQNSGTEPPASKQEEGWQPQERPPAGWLNWLFNRSYKAIEELQEKAMIREEGDFAARQELEEHKADSAAHGIGDKLQEFSEHIVNDVRHIYQGDILPQDAEEGALWLDTSDNAYQGTVMEDYLEMKQSYYSHQAETVQAHGGIVPSARTITAGNGITGGGDLAANRTLTLGTPSTITASSTNTVGASTHNHAVDVASIRTASGQKLRAEVNSSAPSSPVNGDIWYDSSEHKFKGRANGAWV